jgi:predicted O-methyltransferase YrrM
MKKIKTLEDLKERALFGQIPIVKDDGLVFIIDTLKKHQPTHLLELGSGIGYSAAAMAQAMPSLTITTVELDDDRVKDAQDNIKALGLEERVTVIHADVRSYEGHHDIAYDALFLDASKSQQATLFERYAQGNDRVQLVLIDNLNLHSIDRYIAHSRNARALKRKTAAFVATLRSHPTWECQSFEVGDGIAVCQRRLKEVKDEALGTIESH